MIRTALSCRSKNRLKRQASEWSKSGLGPGTLQKVCDLDLLIFEKS